MSNRRRHPTAPVNLSSHGPNCSGLNFVISGHCHFEAWSDYLDDPLLAMAYFRAGLVASGAPLMNAAPLDPLDDDTSVHALRRDDNEAFEHFFRAFSPKIKGFLAWRYRELLDDQELDEATQVTFFNAWRFRDHFDESRGKLGSWLIGIAVRAAQDILRREKRHKHEPLPQDVAITCTTCNVDPDATQTRNPRFKELAEAMNALPRLQSAIIRADLASGGLADAARLAKRHGVTSDRIYQERSKARHKLRLLMEG